MTTNKQEEHQYAIFVDIDGVLADFAKTGNKIMQEAGYAGFTIDQTGTDSKLRSAFWKAVKSYQTKHGYVVWRDLEVMPDAHVLMNYIKAYHPQILTATGQAWTHAAEQKRAWVTENFGSNIRVNTVETAVLKAQFAGPGRILIDDQMKAITPWIAAGGVGIHHTNTVNTIKQLKELGL